MACDFGADGLVGDEDFAWGKIGQTLAIGQISYADFMGAGGAWAKSGLAGRAWAWTDGINGKRPKEWYFKRTDVNLKKVLFGKITKMVYFILHLFRLKKEKNHDYSY